MHGGQLKQDGDDIVVVDASGQPQLRVTAPKAYGSGGQRARAWLRAEGNLVAPYTTARGRALVDPLWTVTGSMATARTNHTATLLDSGKVLVAGGSDGTSPLKSAELYDPTTGTWSATGPMATARTNHTATVLTSGKVLVAGGSDGTSPLASAELYDPTIGTWSATGPMATARTLHVATWLPSEEVLVVGGNTSGSNASAELYDPVTGTWSATGPMTAARTGHTAKLLWDPWGYYDPIVLIAGGSDGNTALASTEVYDPAGGTWSASGLMATARTGHTATVLLSGEVLVAGGSDGNATLTTTELWDEGTWTWSATGPMATARTGHTATELPGGEVLVAGGSDGNTILTSTELYEPLTGTWSATAPMATARSGHTAKLLFPYGVLVAGGSDGHTALASAEVAPTLAASPFYVTLAPGATQTFTATGGSGTGYTWTLALNNSGGTVASTAGATVGVTDAVQVTDCCSLTTTATIYVSPAANGLRVLPSSATSARGAQLTFTVSGGSGTGYTWALTTNASGANITSTGIYTAGTTGGVVDVVRAMDSTGNTGSATVTVTLIQPATKSSVGCSATSGEAIPLLALAVPYLQATRRK